MKTETMTPILPILLPDLDGDLLADLEALEEWAIGLEHAAQDGAEIGLDAEAVRGAVAVLWGTASRAARGADASAGYGVPLGPEARLLAPDGRHEYEPIRTGTVDSAELAVLRTALEACRTGRPSALADALEDAAERYHAAPGRGRSQDPDPGAPVRTLAAVLDVLTLAGDDVETLRGALADPANRREDGDVVLPPAGADAYDRVATRITRAWHIGDAALERWRMG